MVKDRILDIISLKEISKSRFYKETGLSNGFLDKVKDIGVSKIEYILNAYPDINPIWLLTGEGEMILPEKKPIVYDEERQARIEQYVKTIKNEEDNSTNEIIDFNYAAKKLEIQDVPLYDIEASAGIVSLFNDVNHTNPVDFIRIPGIPKCDGAIPITGDSMYPLLKSGDIVLYKQISDPINGIYFYGEMYIVGIHQDDDEFVVVKYIHKSDKGDDYIKLVSQNQHHDPFDIPKSSIRALAIVRASVRVNSMK